MKYPPLTQGVKKSDSSKREGEKGLIHLKTLREVITHPS